MVKKLHGRECINSYQIAKRVNEIIDLLHEAGIGTEEEKEPVDINKLH